MKTNKLIIATLVLVSLFAYSCGNENKSTQNDHSGHEHAAMVEAGSSRNEDGQLIDAAGNLITGCPGHREMVGSEGDMCPKCEYMTMIPITWDITGVDTVRVTSLADYNPPSDKLKKSKLE